jgi:hypothetical protein
MQYRIQFLDASGNVVRELSGSAQSVTRVVAIIVDADWPPQAVTMCVLDAYGREVHSSTRSDFTKR